uniref:Uncharacterized protein n=1 Tax=Caenorhabditis japonica TaxID=281687 RepID=A0A8R1IUZ3_CAEJA
MTAQIKAASTGTRFDSIQFPKLKES